MFETKGNYRDLEDAVRAHQPRQEMDLLVARGNKQFKMAAKHELEKNSQIEPKAYRK